MTAPSRPPERAWSEIRVGDIVEVDVVGLLWAERTRPPNGMLIGTVAAVGPGFICIRPAGGPAAFELTVSFERVRRHWAEDSFDPAPAGGHSLASHQ